MSFRLLAPLALSLAAAVPLTAQDFRYAPGEAVYEARVVTRMTREMGGQVMEDEVSQQQRLSVSLAAAGGDTLRIGITLDSAAMTSRSGPQDVSPLVGLQVEGALSPVGQVYSSRLVKGDAGPAGPMIAAELARFLPRLRRDLRVGLAWTDTTSEEVEMLGLPIRRRIITTQRVVGDTTVSGRRAWQIDRTAQVSFTGGGTIQGQAITLEGSSTADGRILVAHSGRYLGSSQTDSVTTNFSSGAMAFAIRQTQTTNVALR